MTPAPVTVVALGGGDADGLRAVAERAAGSACGPGALAHERLTGLDGGEATGLDRPALAAVALDGPPEAVVLARFATAASGARSAAEPPAGLAVAGTEIVHFERATPALGIVAYVHGVAGVGRADFHASYAALGRRLRDEHDGWGRHIARYAQVHVLGDADGPDAVGLLGFASGADLCALLTAPWLATELIPFEARFLDHSRTVQALVSWPGVPAGAPAAAAAG